MGLFVWSGRVWRTLGLRYERPVGRLVGMNWFGGKRVGKLPGCAEDGSRPSRARDSDKRTQPRSWHPYGNDSGCSGLSLPRASDSEKVTQKRS